MALYHMCDICFRDGIDPKEIKQIKLPDKEIELCSGCVNDLEDWLDVQQAKHDERDER